MSNCLIQVNIVPEHLIVCFEDYLILTKHLSFFGFNLVYILISQSHLYNDE